MNETTNKTSIWPEVTFESIAKIHAELSAERHSIDMMERNLIEELFPDKKHGVILCPCRIKRMLESANLA